METVTDVGSGKVLLVEGDPAALGLLSRGLTRFGLSVEGVTDADRAIEAVTASRPDVVVTEVSEGSDLRLLERLRLLPQTQDVPVLLLTKGAWARRKTQLRDLGVQELLAKPAFVQDVAVLSWLHAGSPAKEAQFRGELGDASCAVLLRGLLAGGRSGELLLSPLSGRIAFRDGAIVEATLPPLSGERALLRLVAMDASSYEVSFHPIEGAAKMTVELQELTGRGFEHVRRFTALRRELPALDTVIGQDFRALSGALDLLSPPLRAVLRLFDGRRTVTAVLDDSPFDDITTLASMIQLRELGLLTYPEAEPPKPEPEADSARPAAAQPEAMAEGEVQDSMGPATPHGSMDSLVGVPVGPAVVARAAPVVSTDPVLAAPPPSAAEMDLEDAFFKSAVVGETAPGRALDNPAMRRAFLALALVAAAVGAIVLYRFTRPDVAPEATATAVEATQAAQSPTVAKVELIDAPVIVPAEPKVVAEAPPAAADSDEAELDDNQKLVADGIAAYHARAFKSALAKLQEAVKADPDDPQAQLYLGLTHFEMGKLPPAKAALSKALALDGSNAQAELFLGMIAQEQGHNDEARVHYSAYLSLSPNGEHASEVKSVLRTLKERQ